MNFSEEELKTAIGSLQLDLTYLYRPWGNWGWNYSERLIELTNLLTMLPSGDNEADLLVLKAKGELDEPSDGRIFRGGYLYGYQSEEGRTQEVHDYLKSVLTYPEDNNIEVSLLYRRDQKLNDLGI